MRYDIRVDTCEFGWIAIEDQRYDVDGDSEGYRANFAQAIGSTKWDAVRQLIDKLEEAGQ